MKSLKACSLTVLLAALPPGVSRGSAQDASFGCKVLLCAAATAPSWSGIPYCVPVMQTLFRQLARGGGWPVCPEGHTGAPGYEPFLPCPSGTSPARESGDETRVLTPNPDGDLCIDTARLSPGCLSGAMNSECPAPGAGSARPQRTEPYFVDIATSAGAQRFYFSLRGY